MYSAQLYSGWREASELPVLSHCIALISLEIEYTTSSF